MNVSIKRLVLILSLGSSTAFAGETQTQSTLSDDYIKGFLAGADLTDTEIINRFRSASTHERSDFLKRAFKTRVGDRNALPATYYAGFCIPESLSLQTVVSDLQTQLANAPSSNANTDADLLYSTLRKHYPC